MEGAQKHWILQADLEGVEVLDMRVTQHLRDNQIRFRGPYGYSRGPLDRINALYIKMYNDGMVQQVKEDSGFISPIKPKNIPMGTTIFCIPTKDSEGLGLVYTLGQIYTSYHPAITSKSSCPSKGTLI